MKELGIKIIYSPEKGAKSSFNNKIWQSEKWKAYALIIATENKFLSDYHLFSELAEACKLRSSFSSSFSSTVAI